MTPIAAWDREGLERALRDLKKSSTETLRSYRLHCEYTKRSEAKRKKRAAAGKRRERSAGATVRIVAGW
jgi:ribosomal protein S21